MAKRVLIADDDPRVRDLLAALMSGWDVEVITAADAAEACGKLLEGAIDLLITDYCMPGGSGADLIHRLKAARPACPVIGISGGGELAALQRAGADFCLPKPLDLGSVRELLTRLLGSPAAGPSARPSR